MKMRRGWSFCGVRFWATLASVSAEFRNNFAILFSIIAMLLWFSSFEVHYFMD
jgi:hypothetical protein